MADRRVRRWRHRRMSTCFSVRRTSCASIRSCGKRGSHMRRSARSTRRRACASAATGGAVRRDARRVGGRMGGGARSPSPALRGDLRGQLQLPEQDVPAADAAGGADDDRRGARARHHHDRRRLGRQRSPGDLSRLAAPPSSSPAKARSRWSSARRADGAARRAPTSTASVCATPSGRIVRTPTARHHPRPRRAAVPGLGSGRRRALPRDLAVAPRLLLDEPGDDARVSVSLQLVREADLGPALHRALARARRRRDGVAEADVSSPITSGSPTTSSASSPAGSSGSRRCVASATRAIPFKCLLRADQVTPAVAGALQRARAAGPCGSAPSPARSGSSTRWRRARASSRSSTAARLLHAAGIEVGFFLQFGYPGETRDGHRATLEMVRACRRTTSACRCRIRCRARRSTSASRRSSGRSRTGSTPTTSR